MARKNYSEEFRRQAVDLYESTPGATVRGIAEDLGIVRGTLRGWLEVYGTGKKTAADGTLTSSPLQSRPSRKNSSAPEGETPEQKIARLEARVAELERTVDEMTSDDEDMAEYIRQLEENDDAAAANPETLPEIDGEQLAADFERYLRRRNPDAG